MNTDELTALLTRITILDNRPVDALTIEAWEPIVGDLDFARAVDAVNAHFRESTEYLKPAHIVQRVNAYKRYQFTADVAKGHVHAFNEESGYCAGCGLRDDDVAALEVDKHRRENGWMYQ